MIKFFKKLSIIFIVLFFAVCAYADSALQVDFLLAGYRHPTSDAVLSGGKVYSYLDGTSTLSALWTDKDKGGTAANPVILDSSGKAEVFGDNIYKFLIYDSDDVLIETLNGLSYEIEGSNVFFPDYSAIDQGVTGSNNTLKYYIDTIGSDQSTIVLRHNSGSAATTYTITTSVTIPSNITLKVERGAVIDGAGTLTFEGGSNLLANRTRCFSNTFSVVFNSGSIKEIMPEWKGAIADDSTDNLVALTWALQSGVAVSLGTGVYKFSDTITVTQDVFSMYGTGMDISVIENTAVDGSPALVFQCDNIDIKHCGVHGNPSSGSGINFDDSSATYMGKIINIINVSVWSHGEHGIKWIGGEDRFSSYVNITNCRIAGNHDDGINSEGAQTVNTITLVGNYIHCSGLGNGVTLEKSQMLTMVGNSIQSAIKGVEFGAVDGKGFIATGNYFEGHTEAGICLGATGVTTTGFTISGNYFHNGSITNATEGAAIQIWSGQGEIGANYVGFESATKKYVWLDPTVNHSISISELPTSDITFSEFSNAKINYTGFLDVKRAMGPIASTAWSPNLDRSSNVYAAGGTYYFNLDVTNYKIIDRISCYLKTDNADSSLDITLYKRNMGAGGAMTQVATLGASTGNGLKSLDLSMLRITNASGEYWGYTIKIDVVSDGAGGTYDYIYTPHAVGMF